jgi:glucose/mannose-6-phosphate isomerase
VSILDDPGALRDGDPQGMLGAFSALPDQLGTSFRLGLEIDAPPATLALSVVFCAMGGSAAAGDVVASAYREAVEMPLIPVRGYRLPGFCGPSTLVICSSFSGNTEETVAAYREAALRGCRVLVVCSGGELEEMAGSDGVPVLRIPADVPMPRAGLGHLVGATLGALTALGVLEARDQVTGAQGVLEALAGEVEASRPVGQNEAKDLAIWLGDRIPVVWGSEGVSEAAAWRWKSAFNENAKMPAFASTLPELDHHEVVGWAEGPRPGFALVVLREEGEHETVDARLAATREEIGDLPWREASARGASPLSRALSLIMLGDMASAYHALARSVDPAPIESLERIKRRLVERGP